MTWDERLKSLTTGMVIEIGDLTITCRGSDVLKSDLTCIKYLRNIAKKSNHIFPTTMSEFFVTYDKYKNTTKNVKINSTHLYVDDTNVGTFACVGDMNPLSEADMIETGLKNSFYSTLGKIIFSKLENLELDVYNIFDTLIELSSESLLDPSLKINEMTYTEMGTKIMMYLPQTMLPCTESTINTDLPESELDGWTNYIIDNKEIEFFDFIKKLVRTHTPPLTRLELTKTYIIILNFYIRTSNRIRGFQKSEGTAIYQEKPWNILWSQSTSKQDLICYCNKILQKQCSKRTLRKLYNLLSRDKITTMTDLVYTLNLGEDFIPKKSKTTFRQGFLNNIKLNDNNIQDLKQALQMNKLKMNNENDIDRPQQDQTSNLDVSIINYPNNNVPNIHILQNDQQQGNTNIVPDLQEDVDYDLIPVVDGDGIQDPTIINRSGRNTDYLETEKLTTKYEHEITTTNMLPETTESAQPLSDIITLLTTTTSSILSLIDNYTSQPVNHIEDQSIPSTYNTPIETSTDISYTHTTTWTTFKETTLTTLQTTTSTTIPTTTTTNTTTPTSRTIWNDNDNDNDNELQTITSTNIPTTTTLTTTTYTSRTTWTTTTTSTASPHTSHDTTSTTTSTRPATVGTTTTATPTTTRTRYTQTTSIHSQRKTTTSSIRSTNTIRRTTRSQINTKTSTHSRPSSTTTITPNFDYYDMNTIDDGGNMDSLIHRKVKRSFVSYWLSSMTGLAEQNELEDMKRFENELLERENTLGSTFGNLTIQDQELTQSIQNISEKMAKSLHEEQQINEQITKIISSQISGEQNVNKILGILDKNIKKTNKLTQILMELLFLEKTVEKYKMWITNVLMDRLDIFDLNMRELSQHLGSSAIQSLKLSKAKIVWDDDEFSIIVTIRKLSEPFQIFNIKSMVVSFDKSNLNMGNTLNIAAGVAINSIGEYLFSTEYLQKCITVGNTIYCNGKDVLIHMNGTETCEIVIIHNWLNNDTRPYIPCYDKIVIRPTLTQDFIIKENSIIIMSREQDIGRYHCTGGSRDTARNLNINRGLNRVINTNGCGIDTNFLSIPGGYISHQTTASGDLEDLDLDLALIELNNYMTTKIKRPFNLSLLIESINSTQDKLLLEHNSLEDLQRNVDSLNTMTTIPKFSFNPLHALNYDSHKLVTMGLSYTVLIIILILLCVCCFNVATGSTSLCCAPCKCIISLFKCCTQCFTHVEQKLKTTNERGHPHEFEGILNNSNLKSSGTNVTYISTAPDVPNTWVLRTIDDEQYLIYEEDGVIYKFDPITNTAWSGREKNERIKLPSAGLRKMLEKRRQRDNKKLYPETMMD